MKRTKAAADLDIGRVDLKRYSPYASRHSQSTVTLRAKANGESPKKTTSV
jgi:hypothetical protein